MNKADVKTLKTALLSIIAIFGFMALGVYLVEIDRFVVPYLVLFVVVLLGSLLYFNGFLNKFFK